MPLNLVVSTQTPLLRFDAKGESPGPAGAGLPPHRLSPGGVCRIVLPTLEELRDAAWVGHTNWYSLNPGAPPRVELEGAGVTLHHMQMKPAELAAYGRSKEKLWADIHGLPAPALQPEDFRQYVRYNARTADSILEHAAEMDLAYIHDFQLMQVGGLMGLAAPCVLHWHVPWDPRRMPPYTRQFLLRMMEDFDAVIVSCRRDLQGLMDAGFRGRVRQVSPHIEPRDWPTPTSAAIAELEHAWGLGPDDPLFLLVARMDPMKRHDLAIQAFARIAKRLPGARLVLVGNGSFSGHLGGGDQKPGKADLWRAHLEAEVARLGVGAQVRFTHWVPDRLLGAAYARATAVLLPSDVEGFGLTPLEAWAHGRPAIVSAGIGASEIILDGVNGIVFPPGDDVACAAAMERLARDPGLADRMGEVGRLTLANFTPRTVVPRIRAVLDEALHGFSEAQFHVSDRVELA